MFYHYSSNWKSGIYSLYRNNVNIYYGITQNPNTQELVIIMPYYNFNLTHYTVGPLCTDNCMY